MVAELAAVKQDRNTAVLKVIEKEGAIGRMSEQLQSECRAWLCLLFFSRALHDSSFLFIFQRFRPSWSNLEHLGSNTQSP
jgi:hypothetical protein